jgi:hypothetical protein
MADTTLLGLYEEIDDAAKALSTMRGSAGFASQDLMILSSVPFPEGVLEADRSKIRLPQIALTFAIVGILFGVTVAGGTALLYVIRTGGKPIMSGPPIGIISYEFMMLFALVFAFLGALYEMRLPNWRAKVYDPRISEGYIGVAAHCGSDEAVARARTIFTDTKAMDITTDNRSFE